LKRGSGQRTEKTRGKTKKMNSLLPNVRGRKRGELDYWRETSEKKKGQRGRGRLKALGRKSGHSWTCDSNEPRRGGEEFGKNVSKGD